LIACMYAGLNEHLRLLIFDELKMKFEWKYH